MPNWAWGSVSMTGTKTNVIKFVNRFVHEEDSGKKDDYREERYFARSFTNDRKQSVLDAVEETFQDIPIECESTFELPVDFAWSAHSCLIDGYPQNNPDRCITLGAACAEDQVSVEIRTEEGGMGFEEHITCDKQGQFISECMDLLLYKCQNCRTVVSIASFIDADDYECPECGDVGLDPVQDETENIENTAARAEC